MNYWYTQRGSQKLSCWSRRIKAWISYAEWRIKDCTLYASAYIKFKNRKKLVCDHRNSTSGCLHLGQGLRISCKRDTKEPCQGDGNILYRYRGGYTAVCICQNSAKWVNFITYKLYINKVVFFRKDLLKRLIYNTKKLITKAGCGGLLL